MSKLIKQSKFVKTAIAAAALGFVAFGAQAGTISVTPAKYAVEIFGGSAPETAIRLPSVSLVTATAIPAGSTVTVAVQLTGARFAVTPTPAISGVVANTVVSPAVDTTLGNITLTLGTTRTTATTVDASAAAAASDTASNADVIYVKLVTETAIGIGGTLLTLNPTSVTAAGLATVGSTVAVTASTIVGPGPSVTAGAGGVVGAVPTTGLLEAASNVATAGTSVQGITLTATTGSSSQKVNVSATKPSTVFTSTGGATASDTGSTSLIQLGTYGQVETSGAVGPLGAAYTVAGKGTNTSVLTVTAPAGYFAALEDTGVITVRAANASSCAGGVLATSTAFADAAAAAAATSIALPATAYGATVGGSTPAPLHICMSVKGNKVIQTGAAQITAKLGGNASVAQDSAETLASTGLLALSNNGATADVASYFPAALSTYGYSTFLRVVNKGAVSAPVSVALIDPVTGVAGTSAVIGTIPAGAATTFTGAQVEAVIGAQGITVRPRLRLTAPTGSLQVQSFLQSPDGTVTEVSGGTSSN